MAKRSKIGIHVQPTDFANEKIINFYSPNGGGLIVFRAMDDGTLRVEVCRTDDTVLVNGGPIMHRMHILPRADEYALKCTCCSTGTLFIGSQDGCFRNAETHARQMNQPCPTIEELTGA